MTRRDEKTPLLHGRALPKGSVRRGHGAIDIPSDEPQHSSRNSTSPSTAAAAAAATTATTRPFLKRRLTPLVLAGFGTAIAVLALGHVVSPSRTAEAPARQQQQQESGKTSGGDGEGGSMLAAAVNGEDNHEPAVVAGGGSRARVVAGRRNHGDSSAGVPGGAGAGAGAGAVAGAVVGGAGVSIAPGVPAPAPALIHAAAATSTDVGDRLHGVGGAAPHGSSGVITSAPAAAAAAAAAASAEEEDEGDIVVLAEERWSGGVSGGSGSERAGKRKAGGWRSGRKQAPDGRSNEVTRGNKPPTSPPASASGNNGGGSSSSSKPNVFFFLIDDMGYGDIGYQSTDLSELTPNLDALMEGGIKLSNYYSMPLCTPARASLMTGRYPVRYGMQYSIILPGAEYGLPLDEKVLPEYMNDAGYESHMVGKWHIGSYNDASLPNRRGFKTYLGYLNGVDTYYEHMNTEAVFEDNLFYDFGFGNETDYYDVTHANKEGGNCAGPVVMSGQGWDAIAGGDPADVCYTGTYSEDAFLGRARQVISEKAPWDKEPLFLYMAHQSVHTPIGPAPEDGFTVEEQALLEAVANGTESDRRTRFAGVLLYLDKKIGEFMDVLDEEGWLDNAIVVVASDNGGCPSHGGCNYPLRGSKQSVFEGGTRVPAMMWSRSHIPEDLWGTEYDKLMHVTDWLPTLMSAIGGETSGSAGALDGIDHWHSMVGSGVNGGGDDVEGPRTEMLYNWDPYILSSTDELTYNRSLTQGAFREGKWKLIVDGFCSGYFSHDLAVIESDPLINAEVTCPHTLVCEDCSDQCEASSAYAFRTRLFDLNADPREEHSVLGQHPEIADRLMSRANELVYSEWTDSNYLEANTDSYLVWKAYDWWMLPWVDKVPATLL